MEETVNLITNTSVTIVVVGFFMYRDLKFMNQLQSTLVTLTDTVNSLKTIVLASVKGDNENGS